jgi:uncharacterized membrane protein YkgB
MTHSWWNRNARPPFVPNLPPANRPEAGAPTDRRGPPSARPAAAISDHRADSLQTTNRCAWLQPKRWLGRLSMPLLRVSLGLIFLWFGVLKFFPGVSSAEGLAGRTIEVLSFGLMKPAWSLPTLAIWECLIGLGLITGWYLRWALLLMFLQMIGTFSPLLLFPDEMFRIPFVPTLEAQYILKNVVFVSAAVVIARSNRDYRRPGLATTRIP